MVVPLVSHPVVLRLPRVRSLSAEYELRHYHANIEEHQDLLNEIASLGLGQRPWEDEASPYQRGGHDHADPTAGAVVRLETGARLRHLRQAIAAVRETYESLEPAQRRMVQIWYWQHWSEQRVCDALGISRATLYRWRAGVVLAVAIRLGLG